MYTKVVLTSLGVVLLAALLLGQTGSQPTGMDWEMISQRVAVGAGGGQSTFPGERLSGEMFLYNRRTGKVYLRFTGCTSNGQDLDGGCFASIAVFGDNPAVDVTPTPTNYSRGQGY